MYEGELTNPLSWNRYTYVQNSPLKYIDPSGHAECGGATNWNPKPKPPQHLCH
ncbi:hypothetical protein [Paenibacillus thiaminolyticus]|uniref:hypothetical protein n=1 Tax=Paenibacillus thiaminolyticus TaxID=49283 RepID=UPI003B97FAB5